MRKDQIDQTTEGGVMQTMLDNTAMRELDSRSGDGIEVRLLWEPCGERVFVAVDDERTGDRFRIHVPAGEALDAFQHPYAFDHRAGRKS